MMRSRFFHYIALVLTLGGCSGPVETHVRSSGTGVAGDTVLMWAPSFAGAEMSTDMEQARAALSAELGARGYRFAAEAPLMLTLGFSERPAHIGVASGQGAALSPAKQPRPFQSCADRIVRISISITDRASGETRYGGSAEEAHCQAMLAEALPRLARLAVADIARPGGDRIVRTAARD